MLLCPGQVSTFWRLWSQACKARGWTAANGLSPAGIDAKRKELLRDWGFDSLTLVDRTKGFTRVKNELIALRGDSVQAGLEADDPALNRARILRHVIRTDILPCLALYESDPGSYLQTVMSGLSRWRKVDRPARPPTLDDFDARPTAAPRRPPTYALKPGPSLLEQIMMTLNARLHAKRREFGHSIHYMRTKAGVSCACAACTKARKMAEAASASNQPF
jgi:hypothetical protein